MIMTNYIHMYTNVTVYLVNISLLNGYYNIITNKKKKKSIYVYVVLKRDKNVI